jgi:hypothetical protein
MEKMEKIKDENDKEKIAKIKIIKGSDAPEEFKKNPFYNSYHWGMARWAENRLFLPDNSDAAITFTVAAHEVGHLANKDRIQPSCHDYEATLKEELRAWKVGLEYLDKHLGDYYSEEKIEIFYNVFEIIKAKIIEITKMGEPFYKSTNEDIDSQREDFLKTDLGRKFKDEIDGLQSFVEKSVKDHNAEFLLDKVDWDKFVRIIQKTLLDVEKDNEKARHDNL